MFETTLPRISSWLRPWRPSWRVSTWWPSDSLESMQRTLLRLLAVAHRERLDEAPLVANLADEHRGRYRRRLRRLARRLADGTSLVDALEQTPDVLSDPSVLAIRFGAQTGTLAATYQHLVEDHDDTSNRNHASLRQTAFYTIIMLVILAVSLSFLMIYIVPTFVQISEELWLQEVDVARPWPFQTLVAIWNNLSRYAPLWILAVILVAWSIWSLPSRRFFRRLVSARWAGSVAQARSAELLRLLAIAVEAGRPVPAAISSLARYHFDKSVRDKLLFARNEMEQGADVWQSLADAQLITPQESNALAQASSARSRVWTMRRLALWKQDTIARRNETVVAFAQPLVTLIFAGVVLLIGTAIFGVLSRLIQVLA